MTLCPVALTVGCLKCPIVTACPLKSVIGDFVKPDPGSSKIGAADTSQSGSDKQA